MPKPLAPMSKAATFARAIAVRADSSGDASIARPSPRAPASRRGQSPTRCIRQRFDHRMSRSLSSQCTALPSIRALKARFREAVRGPANAAVLVALRRIDAPEPVHGTVEQQRVSTDDLATGARIYERNAGSQQPGHAAVPHYCLVATTAHGGLFSVFRAGSHVNFQSRFRTAP